MVEIPIEFHPTHLPNQFIVDLEIEPKRILEIDTRSTMLINNPLAWT
jgi:hypothetical protein